MDDDEIDCYIFQPESRETKARLWNHFNREWIKDKEQREQLAREQQLHGKPPRRARKRTEGNETAAEAAQKVPFCPLSPLLPLILSY